MASIKLKGDTSGEVTIQAPSVAGTTTLNLPATSSTLATQNSLGVRNLIINGDMQIAQRGTSVSGITSSSGNYYTVDRMGAWMTSAGTWTMTQDNDVPSGQGFAKSMKWSCTTANASLSAGSYLHLTHNIEAQNCQVLKFGSSSAESFTLSFWVKSNKTGTYVVEFHHDDASKTLSKTYTIDTADTWEKKTVTVAGNTANAIVNDNGMGLQIWHWLLAGTNFSSGTLHSTWTTRVIANDAAGQTVNLADNTANYINITGVQLEANTTATPFEHRMYSQELAMCQRYLPAFRYNTSSTVIPALTQFNSTTTSRGYITFPVPTRVSVTGITISSASHFILLSYAGGSNTPNAFTMHQGGVNGAGIDVNFGSAVSADTKTGVVAIDNSAGYVYFTGAEL